MYLKLMVRSVYDLQKVRIMLSNRLSKAGKGEETLTVEAQAKIQSHYSEIYAAEKNMLKTINKELKTVPVWTEYLQGVRGIGPALAGIIISELIDIERFETISKLWSYCGFGLYGGEIQKRKKGEKANWNNFLKCKLFLLAECFIKTNNQAYRKLYDDYKYRLAARKCPLTPERHGGKDKIDQFGCTAGHRHAMAMRYMIKMFLKDLYLKWHEIKGITPRPSYQEEYLGHKHVA